MYNPQACIEMIRQLIANPSVSSVLPEFDMSNRCVIDLLAGWLENDGYQVEILKIENTQNKYNLIARKGHGDNGLVLSGHTDTVPCDASLWQSDPFTLFERDDRLYGLGACDMKSFFSLAIEAGKSFPGKQLKQPLIILATADEESTMAGAQSLLKFGKPKAHSAIIGEPTNNVPIRLHKGVMMERIQVIGKTGHSSDPTLGHSAVEGMHKILCELLEFRNELQAGYKNPLFHVAVPTLNLGRIHGGDSPNRICGTCSLDIDLRPLPGMALEELRCLLRNRLQHCLQKSEYRLEFSALFPGTPPLETAANSNIVKLTESLTGHNAGAVAFATEAPYLQALGMDVVVMGPGKIDLAHQPNEYLEINDIPSTVSLLRNVINQHCVIGH